MYIHNINSFNVLSFISSVSTQAEVLDGSDNNAPVLTSYASSLTVEKSSMHLQNICKKNESLFNREVTFLYYTVTII